MLETATL